ncbi:MAG: hypothetical protein HY754_13730 [Nitrospirae bacterium]|nr:hypothetical protein [Nitrospirota bacterium]
MKTIFLTLIFILTLPLSAMGKQVASSQENIIGAIDNAIKSLEDEPNQFNLTVSVTGLSVNQSGSGGTDMVVNVTGGGAGSNVTGLNVSMNGNEISIAKQTANDALIQQSQKAIKILEELKQIVSVKKPEGNKVKSTLSKLNDTYIAPIAKSVIIGLITKWLKIK